VFILKEASFVVFELEKAKKRQSRCRFMKTRSFLQKRLYLRRESESKEISGILGKAWNEEGLTHKTALMLEISDP